MMIIQEACHPHKIRWLRFYLYHVCELIILEDITDMLCDNHLIWISDIVEINLFLSYTIIRDKR